MRRLWPCERDAEMKTRQTRRGAGGGKQRVIKWNPERVSQPDSYCGCVFAARLYVFCQGQKLEFTPAPPCCLTFADGPVNQAPCQCQPGHSNIKHWNLCSCRTKQAASPVKVFFFFLLSPCGTRFISLCLSALKSEEAWNAVASDAWGIFPGPALAVSSRLPVAV